MLLLAQEPRAFPERSPTLIEACLRSAADTVAVTRKDNSAKYICEDEPAAQLWACLVKAKVPSWAQQTVAEGLWLSRSFPLGACFKRLRTADGAATGAGLSCTIWIPQPARSAAPRE